MQLFKCITSFHLVIVFCFSMPFLLKAETLSLVAMEYPPYYGSKLEKNGPLPAIIRAVLQEQGYSINIEFLPWARALKQVYSGDAHGIIGIWKSPERQKRFIYSQALLNNQMGFYSQKSKQLNIKDLANIKDKGYKLASARGYILPAKLSMSSFENFSVVNDSQSLRMLDADRVDLIIVDYFYAQYMFKQVGFQHMPDKLEWLGVIDNPAQHLAISKKYKQSQQLISSFNKGLTQLRASGKYCLILQEFEMGSVCQN